MPRLIRATLAVVLAVAAACGNSSGGGGDGGAASTTTTTAAPSSTTTVTTAPGRIEQVLVALLTVRNKVFSAPDPARVGEYVLSDCRCFEEDKAALGELRDQAHHWATPIVQLEGVRVTERKGPDEAVLTAVASRPKERIVNPYGTQVGSEGPGLAPSAFRFVLRRKDGAWRIADVSPLTLPAGEVDKIVAEGIPSGPPGPDSAA